MARRWPNSGRGVDLVDINREWPGEDNGFNAPSRHAALLFHGLFQPNADFSIDFHSVATGMDGTAFHLADMSRPEIAEMAMLYPIDQIFDSTGGRAIGRGCHPLRRPYKQGRRSDESPAGPMTDPSDRTTHFGYETVPEAEKAGRVHGVFSSVARRYDLMNDAMSLGVHRLWKDAMLDWLAPRRASTRSTWPAAPATSPSACSTA